MSLVFLGFHICLKDISVQFQGVNLKMRGLVVPSLSLHHHLPYGVYSPKEFEDCRNCLHSEGHVAKMGLSLSSDHSLVQ